MRRTMKLFLAVGCGLLLGLPGFKTTATEILPIDLNPRISHSADADPLDPVIIRSVRDNRRFQTIGSTPESIGESHFDVHVAIDIDDDKSRARSIGWAKSTRNYVDHHRRIMLRRDDGVTGLMREAVTEALSRAGYKVVGKTDAGYDGAPFIDVEIDTFWFWSSPYPAALMHRFLGTIDMSISGPLVGDSISIRQPVLFEGANQTRPGAWKNTVDTGLEDLIEALATRIWANAEEAYQSGN